MVLTPEEIQSREFLVSLRGYDRDEVHAFLDEVAEAFATLLADLGDDAGPPVPPAEEPGVRPVLEKPEPTASPFAAIGAETQRILDAAAEAAEEIRGRAEAEAATLREQRLAEMNLEVDALRDQADATQRQIDALQAHRRDIADKLQQVQQLAELALSEVDEGDAVDDPGAGPTAAQSDDPDQWPIEGPDIDGPGGDGAEAEGSGGDDPEVHGADDGDMPAGDGIDGDAPEDGDR